MARTVTATQTAGTRNGILLRVFVLTGAAAVAGQNGDKKTQSGAAAHQVTLTPGATGSRIYGAITDGTNATVPANSGTTMVDNSVDNTNTYCYATCKSTSLTTAGVNVTNFGTAASFQGGIAAAEIKKSGTLAEDASAPAVASTTAGTSVTSASFTPPAGALLVALVASDGAVAAATNVSVSDSGGLTWTALAEAHTSGNGYAGVWIADVPSGATGTGAAALKPISASASGQFILPVTGTGAAGLPHLQALGSGPGFVIPNTGSAALPHLMASGTGLIVPQGAGAAALPRLSASGGGNFIPLITGTGAAQLPRLSVSAADEGALQAFKTLILHRPRIDAPPSLTPFVSIGGTDPPDGREYNVPSLVAGVNARFDGTYSILAVNNLWHSPANQRTITVTIHQHEYLGGPAYTVSVSRTLTPSTDTTIANGLVDMGELTLPIRRISDQNVTAFFTVGITSTDSQDRFLDILFLDTQGSTVVINSATAYSNFFVDEPGINQDLGAVLGSAFDRPAAVSVLQDAKVSGGPLSVEPGDNLLLAYCVEGAPSLSVTYSPKWYEDALA